MLSCWKKFCLRDVFSFERVICRLLAAWCCFSAYNLLQDKGFNVLSYAQDTSLWSLFGFVLLVFTVLSVVNGCLPSNETDTWFLFITATLCVARWLTTYNGQNHFLFVVAVLLIYSFFILYIVRKNAPIWKQWNPNKTFVWAVVIAGGLFCGFIIAAITCYRYLTFSAPNFDFGLFVNMFHNMKESGLPLCTSERDVCLSHFVVHLSPVFYLLLPFYALFPSPLTLQIGQAVVLASGVVPVALLCKQYKLSGKCTAAVTLLYAFHPSLSTGCFYDIHENCFLTPFLLWAFYFYEQKKHLWMYVFVILTLTVKEDAAVYIVLFSIYLLCSKKDKHHGIVLLFLSLLYFGVALSLLQMKSTYYADLYAATSPNPAIDGPMINRFDNLIFEPTTGLMGVLKTALVNPGYLLTQLLTTTDGSWGKLVYVFQMFLPMGFLPLFTDKPSRWLLTLSILINLLTNYPYQYDIGFQYHFGILAFLIYATILNLPNIKPLFRCTVLSVAAAACCCLYFLYVLPTYSYYHNEWQKNKETYLKMEQILETVPKDASVCCSTFLVAHLAERDEIYELTYHDGTGDVDYIILDARYGVKEEEINPYLEQGYIISQEYPNTLVFLTRNDRKTSVK